MPRIPYTKPAKSYEELLTQLKHRGLKVRSDDKVRHLLAKLGYYRLSGYWYPLLKTPKEAHQFKDGADFQTAFKIYRFDRDLRIFILKELEKIEVAVRSQMIHILSHSHNTPFWYTDSSLFSNSLTHTNSVTKITGDYNKSDEDFIKKFKLKYSNPLPPCWMALEIASFGTLSVLYSNLRPGRDKRDIADHFGLDDTTFGSWLHSFVYIRNVCAHHSRLWNRAMSIRPQIPITPKSQWIVNHRVNNNRTYFILTMMLYLLQAVDKKHQFIYRFKVLLKKYHNIDVKAMGFPADWKKEPLWKFKPTLKQRVRLTLVFKVS